MRRSRAVATIASSGYLDRPWYEAQVGRTFSGDREAIRHYVTVGRFDDLSPHPLYEAARHVRDEHRRMNPNFVPFASFLRSAKSPRHRPHHLFDPVSYLTANPKARSHPYGAWGHFLQHATPDTPLPLPAVVAAAGAPAVTWGAWLEHAHRHVREWAVSHAVSSPSRVTPTHDEDAERRLRAELASHPMPSADGPLISVITAVRNRPVQILAAVASVVGQSVGNWELIVVDDGSDDATPDVVEAVAAHDLRITVLRLPHTGVSAARNAGAAAATGHYVAWLDSDNTWSPEYLEVMARTLAGRGARAGYAASEVTTDGETQFREFSGGLEHLAAGNFVDLNVLVVEASVLAEVGGFDETLPKAVDYDLVYRIAALTPLTYVPLVGVAYTDDSTDTERISVKHLHTWNYVVRDRYVVDWPSVQAALPDRVAGRVSVVVSCHLLWAPLWATVASVLAHTPGDVEVVVVDSASARPYYLLNAIVERFDPRVRVIRSVVNYNRGGGRNIGLKHSTGTVVALLAAGAVVTDGWLEPLLEALTDPDTVAATPLVIGSGGLVRSAGVVMSGRATLPVRFLEGHPMADCDWLGERVDVPAADDSVLLARAEDLIDVHGYDPLYVDAFDDVDLCLRLRAATGGRCLLVPASVARNDIDPRQRPDDPAVQNRRLFVERWRDSDVRGEGLWTAAGFDVLTHRLGDDGFPDDIRRLYPVVRPSAGRGRRWAVEVPGLPGHDPALDDAATLLTRGLAELGEWSAVRWTEGRGRADLHLDDVVVVLHGTDEPPVPVVGRLNVLVSAAGGPVPASAAAARFDAVVVLPRSPLAERVTEDPTSLSARLVDEVDRVLAGEADRVATSDEADRVARSEKAARVVRSRVVKS